MHQPVDYPPCSPQAGDWQAIINRYRQRMEARRRAAFKADSRFGKTMAVSTLAGLEGFDTSFLQRDNNVADAIIERRFKLKLSSAFQILGIGSQRSRRTHTRFIVPASGTYPFQLSEF